MATVKDSTTSVLRLKLGKCRNMETRRAMLLLHKISEECNTARTSMVTEWLLRERKDRGIGLGKSKFEPKQRTDRKGNPVFDDNDNPVLDNPTFLYSCECSKLLYNTGTATSPEVSTGIIAQCAQEVLENLKSDLPVEQRAPIMGVRQRWQGVLAGRDRAPLFLRPSIPVLFSMNANCFAHNGRFWTKRNKAVTKVDPIFHVAKNNNAFQIQLFSGRGKDRTCLVFTLPIRKMEPGYQRVWKKLMSNEFTICDSELVFKPHKRARKRLKRYQRGGKEVVREVWSRPGKRGKERDDHGWYLHLVYKRPSLSLGLDPKREAVLSPTLPDAPRPFQIAVGEVSMFTGDGRQLVNMTTRPRGMRADIKSRHKFARSGRKGHGRQFIEHRVRPLSRVARDAQDAFLWKLIERVVGFCRRYDCGTVRYEQPIIPCRDSLWFGAHRTSLDWTSLKNKLEFKLKSFGIKLVVEDVNFSTNPEDDVA